jgi:hypothetical protein
MGDIYSHFGHGSDRQRIHMRRGICTGAFRFPVIGHFIEKSLGHLAASRVLSANEKYFSHVRFPGFPDIRLIIYQLI